ncbi:MAG: D-cysteine desulfhydrase family protein [Desulfobacteraceae bacterium]|jgi:D-cysteine desulfhydrase|nr:D-cysteine desulfhydrase family protein [Desulfobacteraceae bacterium]
MTTCSLSFPPQINLAKLPTPMQPLHRLSERYGVELYVKRDDLSGIALSGNKIRKLEFVLADALAQKTDTVITCGGAQSNHCRATAIAAAMLGINCRLILRTPDPSNPPPLEGNILLDRMAGAEIVWITPDEYKQRDEFMAREAATLQTSGRKAYTIPMGASNALGALGYIRAMEELVNDIANSLGGGNRPCTIINAVGSGGTSAGLILGAKLFDVRARIAGVNVSDDRAYFVRAIGDICEQAIADYHLDVEFSRQGDVEIIDGYVGEGYGLSKDEELDLICDVARTEGIFLDPVYTGKAFFGMIQELKRNPKCFGEQIIFLHTGGIFGLFPKADQLRPLLEIR